jgi:NADP-dependent aldehyde dehydrogenase
MELHGKNIIASKLDNSGQAKGKFTSHARLGEFEEAGDWHIEAALIAAERAFHELREITAEQRAAFLDKAAEEILALGDELIECVHAETALAKDRLIGERGRTVNQLKLFAEVVREGSWVEARIDRAQPERQPLPKPDIRRMLVPLGPVAVFSASNFPLAFSVAGGDTASAFAAGCPVVVKVHSAHPATSELVGDAVCSAVAATGMPPGIFSVLHGTNHELGTGLVKHPLTKAVGFTGSQRVGRLLFDTAAQRPAPIPVYAEMGSINPVFVLPGALRERADAIAEGLKGSVTLGVGQFCTCPGLAIGLRDDNFTRFAGKLSQLIEGVPPATMLYPAIAQAYAAGVGRLHALEGLQTVMARAAADESKCEARAAMFATDAQTFLQHHELSEEVFGPSTVVVACDSRAELEQIASNLEGHLTATIHGTAEDLVEYKWLLDILTTKAGRLLFNGYPTGVEVCPSMQHGGPYPATTDSRTTSVGTAAITRFARPVAYQNFPQETLPVELQDANPRGIWRLIDGELTKAVV